jgi:hypothetical protein
MENFELRSRNAQISDGRLMVLMGGNLKTISTGRS